MILFSLLMLLALIPYFLRKRLSSYVLVFSVCFLIYLLFLVEYVIGSVDYLISDGFKYFDEPEVWIANIDRSFWGYVNYIEKYWDPLGHIFIKLLNIPILLLFLFYFQKTFPKIKAPYNFIFLYPYLGFLAISNLRDILIWLFALLIIRNYNKRIVTGYFLAVVFSIALYMLRPFMLATAWLAILIFEVGPLARNFILKINVKKLLSFSAFVLVFGVVLYFASPTVSKKIHSYKYNATYLITQGYEKRAKLRKADDVIDASNMPKAIFMSHVRYVLTPMPHAITKRFFSSELVSEYGNVSEVLRLYTQLVYYFVLFWLILNFKYVLKVIGTFVFEQRAYLLWLLAFFPIYSIAHFGGSHQRLKLPFQLLVLVLFFYARYSKKLKEI